MAGVDTHTIESKIIISIIEPTSRPGNTKVIKMATQIMPMNLET